MNDSSPQKKSWRKRFGKAAKRVFGRTDEQSAQTLDLSSANPTPTTSVDQNTPSPTSPHSSESTAPSCRPTEEPELPTPTADSTIDGSDRHQSPTTSPHSQTHTQHAESSTHKNLKKTWNGLVTVLRVLERTADAFPPLKSTVGGLIACVDLMETVKGNREDYEELTVELTTMVEALAPHLSKLVAEDVSGSFARIVESIQEEVTQIQQLQDRGMPSRVIEANHDKGDIVKRYRRIVTLFHRLQSDISLRTWETTSKLRETALLERLCPVEDARYNSSFSTTVKRRGCTASTRQKTLHDLLQWAKNPDGAKVYWMNGMAGTGKTTLLYTFCESLFEHRQLGGNYFCSRISFACRDVNQIMPTLAYQLAQYSSAFRSELCKVLEKEPQASKLDVTCQFRKLVLEPMQVVRNAMPEDVVVIIDALDECEDNTAMALFLRTLLKDAELLPIKFFVTSRPEPAVREKMLMSRYSSSVLYLHDIEASIVKGDITLYLNEAFSAMSPRPSPIQVEKLAVKAGKLFIYAATVVRYVFPDDSAVDSLSRLQKVLERISRTTKQHEELDSLYASILAGALDAKKLEDDELDAVQLTLRTTVCAKEPLTVQALATLLGLTEHQVRNALRRLRSVLHVQEGINGLVSPFHASFPDFMFDTRRSGEFYCEKKAHSTVLANGCFDVMKSGLRFNICNLPSSFLFDKDVPGLEERVRETISDALSYACRFWGEHVGDTEFSEDLHRRLVDFVTRRLLFWMEVLNLQHRLTSGSGVLQRTLSWLKGFMDTRKQIADASAFVTRFSAGACSRSTPHIYISGLPFCRKSSSVYRNYWKLTTGLIDVKGTVLERWQSEEIAVWQLEAIATSVAFSSDGGRVVSGSEDGTIRVWDAHSGDTLVNPFQGHSRSVTSVAFSPDGSLVASASVDYTINVWDSRSADIVAGPFKGHEEPINSIVFSDGGNRIVSGSDDNTIRVWDTFYGTVVDGLVLRGHTDRITSVACSPDGRLIISGSFDRTLRLWDARSGQEVATPFKGHTRRVTSVAFSPDGKCIVSGAEDATVRVWDANSGGIGIGPLTGHKDAISSVAFSPDGGIIVSGSQDFTILVWDSRNGALLAGPLKGHVDRITSISFSPDGSRLVSASGDKTIRIWDTLTGDHAAGSFEGHRLRITSAAFSPDGTRIVSASDDQTIRMWDASSGYMIGDPFEGHMDAVLCVAFSSDGAYVVSGSDDETIILWDAHTGCIIAGPFECHEDAIHCVVFSPDIKYIASGSADETVGIWHTLSGDAVIDPLLGHTDIVNSVAFSADGTRVVSGSSDTTVRVWDTFSGVLVAGPFTGHTSRVTSVAFSPDGRYIVSSGQDQAILLWDAFNGGAMVASGEGQARRVNSVSFSPDGSHVASGSMDHLIRVWDTVSVEVTLYLKGHTDAVTCVSYSPDGGRIVSASADRTLRIWNARDDYPAMDIAPNTFASSTTLEDGRTDSSPQLDFTFDDSGWVYARDFPFFWIPPAFRSHLPYPPHNTLVIGPNGTALIQYRQCIVGTKWENCFLDNRGIND